MDVLTSMASGYLQSALVTPDPNVAASMFQSYCDTQTLMVRELLAGVERGITQQKREMQRVQDEKRRLDDEYAEQVRIYRERNA